MNREHALSLVFGPALAALVYLLPTPEGLSPEGQAALSVMALCMVWWIFAPVALPITALVGLALLPMLGALPATEATALFGNQAVFFIIGVFLIAAAMLQSGLSTRIALIGLRRLARSEDTLCYAVLFLSWALCGVVVSHAVAALMLPLVLEIIRSLQLPPNSRLAKRLLLSLAWGTVCGSNLTLQSSARASLAVELYRGWRADSGLPPDPVSFVDYTLSAGPTALVAVLLAGITLRLMFPPQGLDLTPAITSLDERVRAAGRMKREEWLTVATVVGMLTTIVGWGLAHGLGTMALLWSAFLFATRVLDWEDAERYVNWGVALLYGGAIAVGASLERTGAAEWLVRALLPDVQFSPWVYFAALSLLAAGLTEVISNAAVIALILPVALHLTDRIGVEPRALLFALPVCTGAAYALPTSTPAMALVFGTPYLRVRDTLVAGIVLAILCVTAFVALSALVWPLFGLRVIGGRP